MPEFSPVRKLSCGIRRFHHYWTVYGGLRGSCGKALRYWRLYGAKALLRRVFAVTRSQPEALQRLIESASAETTGMVYLDAVATRDFTPPSICVHIHLYYVDLAETFLAYLRNIPYPFTLLVSVVNDEAAALAGKAFADLALCEKCDVRVVENRGRDIAPMFRAFGGEVAKYDVVAHFHSKKTRPSQNMGGLWRDYMLDALLGSPEVVRKIMYLFRENEKLGLVYPQTFELIPFWCHHWLANERRMTEILNRLGRPPIQDDFLLDFPAGSMFWARTGALRSLLRLRLQLEDFEEEAGQFDGTLAHALERLIGYVAAQEGYQHAILKMKNNPHLLRWGMDSWQDLEQRALEVLSRTDVKLIVFDIFDTLLVRPLRRAEDTKKVTAARLSGEDGKIYTAWRVRAEEEARERKGGDVDIDDIFAALADLAGISAQRAAAMREMEILVELNAAGANESLVRLACLARKSGKRIVYASDMFLKRDTILEMLRRNNVPEPDHLYLSNEINRRKDTGDMYRHILEQEGVDKNHLIMVGDNPRSDIQIATDMGIYTVPVPRLPDMLRGTPRHATLAEEPFTGLRESLAIGQVFRHMRQKARPLDALEPFGFFHDFHGIGYGILGPVLTGFADWLAGQARERGIEKFYFLARDGKIMRRAYEAWRHHTGQGPASEYLEVSRRSVSVPALTDREQLLHILSLPFKGDSCGMLFRERTGLDFSNNDIAELRKQGLWPDLADNGMDEVERVKRIQTLGTALWPRIREHAGQERISALAYLRSMGLADEGKFAVVDVGYTGSIQRNISRLLGKPLEGFYLLTGPVISRADPVEKNTFAYIAADCPPLTPFIETSFKMEKLLSASEGQVVSYRLEDSGAISVCRREFSDRERQCDPAREHLRAGLDAFIEDARAIRENLYPGYAPPHAVAAAMWLQLAALDVPGELLLDDFYCAGTLV